MCHVSSVDALGISDEGSGGEELGYQPRPVEDAIRDAWAFFQTYGYR